MKIFARFVLAIGVLGFAAPAIAAENDLEGDADAVAAAWRLLDAAGGREAWAAARTMYAREQAYPPAIDGPVDVHIFRDLEAPSVYTEIRATGLTLRTMRTRTRGWRARNGEVTTLTVEDLAVETEGWRQEPYVFYHRLATGGAGLKVALKGDDRLEVFDIEAGRTLCWFVLTPAGAPLKWGNIFDGEVNEHTYGPLTDLGEANLPKWGVSGDGSWRFEYVAVSFSPEPLAWRDPPDDQD